MNFKRIFITSLILGILIVLIACVGGPSFLFCGSRAEFDFSSCTLDELYQIMKSVSSEILSRSDYDSVLVPAGHYIVGEDIPSGHWTIKYAPGEYCLVEYFFSADFSGRRPADVINDYYYEGVCDPDNDLSSVCLLTEFDLDLDEGYHVVLNYGPAVFEPFSGRPSPFF